MNDRLRILWQLRSVVLAIFVVVMALAIAVISSGIKEPNQPLDPGLASPKWEPTLPPTPEPEATVDDPAENEPFLPPDDDKIPENKGDDQGDAPAENSPCECTPTCPCDAEHCTCRGKERCSEVCPCHKKVAKFYCPTCKRNGYCDYDPDVPEDRPHRVCRDCKLWMDRIEPPMSEKEFKAVIYWRNQQRWMQAKKEAEAERRKQRSSMPVYDPFDEDMPSWRPRRFYFNSTLQPAAGCKT